MSDYRDFNDPLMRNSDYEPASRGPGWGWIIAAVFLVIVLAIAFGVGHEPNRVAFNNTTPPAAPAATHMAPPAAALNPFSRATPGLAPRPAPAPAPDRP